MFRAKCFFAGNPQVHPRWTRTGPCNHSRVMFFSKFIDKRSYHLTIQQCRQAVEGECHVPVVRAQDFLSYVQRPPVEWLSVRIIALCNRQWLGVDGGQTFFGGLVGIISRRVPKAVVVCGNHLLYRVRCRLRRTPRDRAVTFAALHVPNLPNYTPFLS